jgi:hypothetical protein
MSFRGNCRRTGLRHAFPLLYGCRESAARANRRSATSGNISGRGDNFDPDSDTKIAVVALMPSRTPLGHGQVPGSIRFETQQGH